jgi:hypothetical protein
VILSNISSIVEKSTATAMCDTSLRYFHPNELDKQNERFKEMQGRDKLPVAANPVVLS